MNKNSNYTINFESQEIIITKKFGKAASRMGSPEFKIMQQLRKEFEGFSFLYKTIEKKQNKQSYKGLTIDEMKRFLSTRKQPEQEKFEKVLAVYENKQGKYASIKKWFLNNYKEAYENEIEELTKNNTINETTAA